jgi:hypothetical protein
MQAFKKEGNRRLIMSGLAFAGLGRVNINERDALHSVSGPRQSEKARTIKSEDLAGTDLKVIVFLLGGLLTAVVASYFYSEGGGIVPMGNAIAGGAGILIVYSIIVFGWPKKSEDEKMKEQVNEYVERLYAS